MPFPVKYFFSTLLHALREERHFALMEISAIPTKASVTTSIMITTSNSSAKRSGLPNQFLDVLLHTIACSELARVPTEPYNLFVIPSLAPLCRIPKYAA
jgi:hypothetical protein